VNGNHATASEVSLAQFYQPGAIKQAQMTPHVAPTAPQFFEAADYRARFPDGRIGSAPSLSSPEHGKLLYAAAVDDMSEAYKTFVAY
jgi:creatinine amidohydrolase